MLAPTILSILLLALIHNSLQAKIPHSRLPVRLINDASPAILNTTSRAAQAFELCRFTSDCRQGLQCFTLFDTEVCTQYDHDCLCVPDPLETCLATSDCPDGEICANTKFFFLNICLSQDNDAPLGQIAEATPPPSQTGSLFMDICTEDSQCVGLPSCRSLKIGGEDECTGQGPCYCSLERPQPCVKSSTCAQGETCAEMPFGHYPFCVSSIAEEGRLSLNAATMPENTQGLTLDPCRIGEDCKGSRGCYKFFSDDDEVESTFCDGRGTCVCLPAKIPDFEMNTPVCVSSNECEDGEVCARSTAFGDRTACVSKDFVDTFRMAEQVDAKEDTNDNPPETEDIDENPSETEDTDENLSETEDEVCVDAGALKHMTSAELVYSSHVTATVLCDEYGSCATSGHVVVWKGQAMMMKSYCTNVGCQERVMEVNSPRYVKGKRVASKTEGLQYTAFAARYESRLEESVIASAVRLGL